MIFSSSLLASTPDISGPGTLLTDMDMDMDTAAIGGREKIRKGSGAAVLVFRR